MMQAKVGPTTAPGIAFSEVPLAVDRGLVAGSLEPLGKSLLGAVEPAIGVVVEAVGVAVLAREDGGATGAADRV